MTHVTYEFHRVRPKLFMSLWYVQCKPCTYLASRLALSPNRPNQAPLVHRHLGVPSAASKMIYEPMVCLTQTEHLSCTDANTVSNTDQNEIPHNTRHLAVSSGASNTISEPTVRSMQTVHQSCTNDNNVSKQIETRFHMTHISKEFYRVPPTLFLSLRYVRHKSCTNLAPRVALSPNGRNRASTCASSPRSLSSASKMISKPMNVQCKLCTYLALPLTLSPNRLKLHSIRLMSLTSSIGCVQNYL
jgi:hypothetical protein